MVAAATGAVVLVRLDLVRFISNVARSGIQLPVHQAQKFLSEWGFRQLIGDLWTCPESQLSCLTSDEILRVIRCSPGGG